MCRTETRLAEGVIMKFARKTGLCAGISIVVLTSCGGGSDSSSGTDAPSSAPSADSGIVTSSDNSSTTTVVVSTTESTTTTVEVTTTTITAATTTLDPRPIDPEDQALALAATLQAASFGEPWKVYSEAAAATVTTDSCAYRPDGAITLLTNGAAQSGPTMQLGDAGGYVSSSGAAFPDESLAMEYIGVLNTDDWAACRVAELQKFQTNNGSTSVVELATRETPTLNQSGFESYAEFDLKSAEGELQEVLLQSTYRLGRAVISQIVELGALSDSDATKVQDDAYTALSDAYDRVYALL